MTTPVAVPITPYTHPTDSGPVTHPADLPDGNPGLTPLIHGPVQLLLSGDGGLVFACGRACVPAGAAGGRVSGWCCRGRAGEVRRVWGSRRSC